MPDEDQGYYIAAVILPDGATLQRTDQVVKEVVEIIKSNPANRDAIAFIILVLILLLKPTGIMGKGMNEKV